MDLNGFPSHNASKKQTFSFIFFPAHLKHTHTYNWYTCVFKSLHWASSKLFYPFSFTVSLRLENTSLLEVNSTTCVEFKSPQS